MVKGWINMFHSLTNQSKVHIAICSKSNHSCFLGWVESILFTFGYGVIQAGIPVYATQFLGLSPKWLGIIFGVNTLAIVVLSTFCHAIY